MLGFRVKASFRGLVAPQRDLDRSSKASIPAGWLELRMPLKLLNPPRRPTISERTSEPRVSSRVSKRLSSAFLRIKVSGVWGWVWR